MLSNLRWLCPSNHLLRFLRLCLSPHLHFLALVIATTQYTKASKGLDAYQVSIYSLLNRRNLVSRLLETLRYRLLNRQLFAGGRFYCLVRYPLQVTRGFDQDTPRQGHPRIVPLLRDIILFQIEVGVVVDGAVSVGQLADLGVARFAILVTRLVELVASVSESGENVTSLLACSC